MELKINVITRLFNRDSAAADYVILGEKSVKVPKLTVEKWKALFERIEALPQIIVNVLAARGTDDFAATAVVGANIAIDEAINIVAVLADVDADYIEKNADANEITDFIRATLEKNDLQRAIKNFRAVLGQFRTVAPSGGKPDN